MSNAFRMIEAPTPTRENTPAADLLAAAAEAAAHHELADDVGLGRHGFAWLSTIDALDAYAITVELVRIAESVGAEVEVSVEPWKPAGWRVVARQVSP